MWQNRHLKSSGEGKVMMVLDQCYKTWKISSCCNNSANLMQGFLKMCICIVMFRGAHVSSWCIPPKPEGFLRTVADFHLGNLKKKKVATVKQGPLWSSTWQDDRASMGNLCRQFARSVEIGKRNPESPAPQQPRARAASRYKKIGLRYIKSQMYSSHTPPACLQIPVPVILWFPANTGCAAPSVLTSPRHKTAVEPAKPSRKLGV